MILIGLGANLPSYYGLPEETLRAAARSIDHLPSTRVIQGSSIWQTAPVPISDQPWYKNAVLVIETSFAAYDLLLALQNIENIFGRIRTVRDAPRLLDLDLLSLDNDQYDGENLTVPHPRMHQRAFVLLPLQEIAPDWIHPVTKEPLSKLIEDLPEEQEAFITEIKVWP